MLTLNSHINTQARVHSHKFQQNKIKMASDNDEAFRVSNTKRPPPGPTQLPSTSCYTAEESSSIKNENKTHSYTRMTKRVSKQWISGGDTSGCTTDGNISTREHSYTPLFQRSYYSQSKSPSPNFNTLHRKCEADALPTPKIKLNLSIAPHLKLRESELRSSVSPSHQIRRANSISSSNYNNNSENDPTFKRGTSPFTYIETTSIKKKPQTTKRRSVNNINSSSSRLRSIHSYISTNENSSSRSTPARDSFKTYLLTQIAPQAAKTTTTSTHQVLFPLFLYFYLILIVKNQRNSTNFILTIYPISLSNLVSKSKI